MEIYVHDPREHDRKIHACYVRFCAWAGLHESSDVETLAKGRRVVYDPNAFTFIIDDSTTIHDSTLNASQTDLLFKYATDTFKLLEREKKEERKREANRNIG